MQKLHKKVTYFSFIKGISTKNKKIKDRTPKLNLSAENDFLFLQIVLVYYAIA